MHMRTNHEMCAYDQEFSGTLSAWDHQIDIRSMIGLLLLWEESPSKTDTQMVAATGVQERTICLIGAGYTC